MFFDPKILSSLLFIILNIAVIFFIKTRTSTIATLIIAHLVLILFFSLTITNYDSFKEIVLTLIAYLMVVLFLITNYDSNVKTVVAALKIKPPSALLFAMGVVSFLIFSGVLYLTNSSFDAMKKNRNYLPSQAIIESKPLALEASDRKKMRLKKKLSENFLLKRSSDVILIIVATSSVVLLLRSRKISAS